MIYRIMDWIKWLYWSGKYTKVELWESDNIGCSDGYYECSMGLARIKCQFYEDKKVMKNGDAVALMEKRHDKLEKKYFGPKYIKSK